MDNYIRRVRIEGLFGQQEELVVDFDESVNCIYGANGTGKTILISLIVNSLGANIKNLLLVPFHSISILTAKSGQNKARKFLTVSKINDQLFYTFHQKLDGTLPERGGQRKEFIVEDGQTFAPEYKKIGRAEYHESDLFDSVQPISWQRLSIFIAQQLHLTYVPLLRYNETNDFTPSFQTGSRSRTIEEGDDLIDPILRVLNSLQLEISKRYAFAQSNINRKLESLSSVIFEKLLFEESYSMQGRDVTESIDSFMKNRKLEGSKEEIERVVSQIKDLNIDIDENRIRTHYQAWRHMQEDLLKALDKVKELEDSESTESEDHNLAYRQYSDAYFRLLASTHAFNNFKSVIDEVRKVYDEKTVLLAPFNLFKKEINSFLLHGKEFDFDDSGLFTLKNNGRDLNITNLSSGEKHLIAILGRVCFSATASSTFITDEPELSLHLEWQRKILPAIKRLSPKTQIIVATHAPAIIPMDSRKINIEQCYKPI